MASPTIHGTTAPLAGGSSTSPSSTIVGDLVVVITAERAGAGVPTHTIQSGYTELFSQPHNDGSTDGRLSVGCKIATVAGAQSYQAFTTSTGSPAWWTGLIVLDKDTFDPSLCYRAAGVTATGTGAPNPPAVGVAATAPLALNDYLFLAISFWHLTASQTLTPTAPTNYTLQTHISAAATGDVACSTRALTSVSTTEDPGAYGDNQTPNGTSSITIAIPAPFAFGKLRQKLYTNAWTSGSAAAFPQNVQQGSLLVACYGRETNSTPTVTDSQSNTWAEGDNHYDATVDWRGDQWYTKAGSTGACSVTVTATGTLRGGRTILEYQGPFHATPLDAVTSADGTSSTPSSGDATPSVNGCLMVGYIDTTGTTSFTPGTGFTADDSQPGGTNADTLVESLIQGTAAAQDADCTLSASTDWLSIIVSYKPPVSGQTISVGQVTETDTAQAIAWAPKRRLVNQVTETDTAQAMTRRKSVLVAQVSESDLCQGISPARRYPVAQVSEVDLAQALVAPKLIAVDQVSEIDLAQSILHGQIIPVGQVSEVDTAQALAWAPKNRLVARVTEIDLAQSIVVFVPGAGVGGDYILLRRRRRS